MYEDTLLDWIARVEMCAKVYYLEVQELRQNKRRSTLALTPYQIKKMYEYPDRSARRLPRSNEDLS